MIAMGRSVPRSAIAAGRSDVAILVVWDGV